MDNDLSMCHCAYTMMIVTYLKNHIAGINVSVVVIDVLIKITSIRYNISIRISLDNFV